MSLMTNEIIATIVGYTLFILSELLSLINIPANGFLHSVILGLENAFKNPEKDIELAQVLIHTNPDYANIINTLSTNPIIQNIVNDLIKNPTNMNNIIAIQTNKDIASVVSIMRNNENSRESITKLVLGPIQQDVKPENNSGIKEKTELNA